MYSKIIYGNDLRPHHLVHLVEVSAIGKFVVRGSITVVPQMVAKITICDCSMASGGHLVALIAKLAKMEGV